MTFGWEGEGVSGNDWESPASRHIMHTSVSQNSRSVVLQRRSYSLGHWVRWGFDTKPAGKHTTASSPTSMLDKAQATVLLGLPNKHSSGCPTRPAAASAASVGSIGQTTGVQVQAGRSCTALSCTPQTQTQLWSHNSSGNGLLHGSPDCDSPHAVSLSVHPV